MKKTKLLFRKALYAILFIGIIPFFLWLWAYLTEHIIRYPAIESPFWGSIIMITGAIIMFWGMFALIKYGNGLPMNAFPPKKLVKKSAYSLLRDPIYWGFGIIIAGISIIAGSASGLWLVTPVTILGMITLVIGYERIDLKHRFQGEEIMTFFDPPNKDLKAARIQDRLSSLIIILSLLLIGNYIILYLTGEQHSFIGSSWKINPIFDSLPLYIFSLLFIMGAPLVLEYSGQIREWLVSSLIALSLSIFISLLWPELGAQYFPSDVATFGISNYETIIWTGIPIFLILLSFKSYVKRFKNLTFLFGIIALILCIFQLVNSRSSILHLLVGSAIFIIAANYFRIWIFLKNLAEKIANSWTEWTIGPIRIINHGIYVGVGAFGGFLLAGWLVGEVYIWPLLLYTIIVIVFSGLWAQLIEGSEKLKRPFGYYGALVGVFFGGLILWAFGFNVWVLIGVGSAVMPWVQAFGRLRCLINGCCHGSPVKDKTIGIKYFHNRSRVCGISGLKGELLHPTQLYAIIWLFFVGFILLVLWNKQFSYSFILGLYLILTGIGRFAEEAYRGEIQTPFLKGLRLYQWTAMASVIIGIILTLIQVDLIDVHQQMGWQIILAAFLGALFIFFAMGVDFPNSNARFSRLV